MVDYNISWNGSPVMGPVSTCITHHVYDGLGYLVLSGGLLLLCLGIHVLMPHIDTDRKYRTALMTAAIGLYLVFLWAQM